MYFARNTYLPVRPGYFMSKYPIKNRVIRYPKSRNSISRIMKLLFSNTKIFKAANKVVQTTCAVNKLAEYVFSKRIKTCEHIQCTLLNEIKLDSVQKSETSYIG